MKSIFSCCWQKSQIDLGSQVSTNTLNNSVWLLSKSRTVKTDAFSDELTENKLKNIFHTSLVSSLLI